MKKLLSCALLLAIAAPAQAANDKIDPDTYICAEFVALTSTSPEPPLFEGLQIDGYAAAVEGQVIASADIMAPLLANLNNVCQSQPTEKVLPLWQKARKAIPAPIEGDWRADKTTCGDYARNEEDGSGFVIWLDGYNRGKNRTTASVLKDDSTLEAYLASCKKKPDALMLDVLKDSAKK